MTTILREAIIECEHSYPEISKQTGVPRMSLMRFARGEGSLRLDKADKLAEYFGLELKKKVR